MSKDKVLSFFFFFFFVKAYLSEVKYGLSVNNLKDFEI